MVAAGPPEHRGNGAFLPATPASPDRVRIDVPAHARFLQVLRVAAASASIEVLDHFGAVDDLRLAIDELAAVAIATARPGARLEVEIWSADRTLHVHGRVAADGEGPTLGDLGRLLVTTVSRSHRLAREGDDVVFELAVGDDPADGG